ncbi:MAG: UbiA family prenyltransferase [Planctomycetota bacterium]
MTISLLPWLRLLRVGTLFSPAADVAAGLCLAGLAWSGDAARAAAASVLAYAAGMVLNDHADRATDAVVRPERPLPSGAITPTAAAAFGFGLLATSVLIAPWPIYYGVVAALILFYDYGAKRVVALGAMTMGALRGLNLAAGAVAVSGMAPPRAVLIAAAAYALYIVGVTVLGVYEDEPKVRRRAVVSIQLVPPLVASLALLAAPEPWPAAAVGFALAAVFLARIRRVRTWDRDAIRGSMMWLLLGTLLYTALLCLAADRAIEAAAIAAAIVPARWIARRIALT